MLSSAVHNCSQTGAHLSPQDCLFSMLVSARPPFKSVLCKSLCNFGQIYTETYRTASFFSLPPSFPSLPGYARITSLTPPPLWPQPSNPPPGTIPTSFALGLLRSCGQQQVNALKKTKNRSRETSVLNNSGSLLKDWIWLLVFSLQSTEEGKEASVRGWVGQKFLDLKGK